MSEQVSNALKVALDQPLTLDDYETYLQELVSEAAIRLTQFQGEQGIGFVKGVAQSLITQSQYQEL